MNKIDDCRGLSLCISKHIASGKNEKVGKWEICRGKYDLDWELFYDGESIKESERSIKKLTEKFFEGKETIYKA